ncbi:MAG: thiamine pyrophosphate-binding protein [Candidatus Tectomicrobia bacterium]|nr:thiamine pyrophosphate-binding protein [Candidatus Tectomicrobia bacterium]
MARTGSQVLLDALRANGAEYLFGIPGTLTLPVYDALIDLPGITPIITRHEQGAGFAADGYAKVSGRTGAVFTVPGPGGTNLATALQSAREDAVPLVAVTSTLADKLRNRSAIHDVDMERALEHVVKKVLVPDSVAGIAPAVEAAYRWARAGRPGPVQVVMKANLFTAEEERVPRPPEFPQPGPLPRADERALDRAARPGRRDAARRQAARRLRGAGGGARRL